MAKRKAPVKRTDDEKKALIEAVNSTRETEGLSVEEASKKHGITFAQFYEWKKGFSGKRKYKKRKLKNETPQEHALMLSGASRHPNDPNTFIYDRKPNGRNNPHQQGKPNDGQDDEPTIPVIMTRLTASQLSGFMKGGN